MAGKHETFLYEESMLPDLLINPSVISTEVGGRHGPAAHDAAMKDRTVSTKSINNES